MVRHARVCFALCTAATCLLWAAPAWAPIDPGLDNVNLCIIAPSVAEQPNQKLTTWQIHGVLAALDDPDPEVRFQALEALSNPQAAGDALVKDARDRQMIVVAELLRSLEPTYQVRALVFIGALGPEGLRWLDHVLWLVEHPDLRAVAVHALGRLGNREKRVTSALLESLRDRAPIMRREAAKALGRLGSGEPTELKALRDTLRDPERAVRMAAAVALINLGASSAETIEALFDALRHEPAHVHEVAVNALASLPANRTIVLDKLLLALRVEPAHMRNAVIRILARLELSDPTTREALPVVRKALLESLHDDDSHVRMAAAEALKSWKSSDQAVLHALLATLSDPDSDVRVMAADALVSLGLTDQPVLDVLLDALRDNAPRTRIRAIKALSNWGSSNRAVLEALLDSFDVTSSSPDDHVNIAVAEAIAVLGPSDEAVLDTLLDALRRPSNGMRLAAAKALAMLQTNRAEAISAVTDVLPGEIEEVADVLISLGPLSLEETLLMLPQRQDSRWNNTRIRFLAYQVSGEQKVGKTDIFTVELIRCLGLPNDLDITQCVHQAKPEPLLAAFAQAWEVVPADAKHLRKDMAKVVVTLAGQGGWSKPHIQQWKEWKTRFVQEGFDEDARALAKVIADIEHHETVSTWTRIGAFTLGGHWLFWTLLLFAYPCFRPVQAIFFWNPWVRRLLGFGYVGFLLTWVPPLRTILFRPFRGPLRSDAKIDELTGYFTKLTVLPIPAKSGQKPIAMGSAIPRPRGQILLEGASGQGKSVFLRHLLSKSSRVSVFLPAWRCKNGVLEAIQSKLHGHAQDTTYLRSLIYSGAIDIYIDGLNEVDPDTRLEIVTFTEGFPHANIILASQPTASRIPSGTTRYEIQPLSGDEILDFLCSRQNHLSTKAKCTGEAFEQACRSYLDKVSAHPASAQQALSNPMDLTTVADLISMEIEPDLWKLQEQQYDIMIAEYKRRYPNRDFPLDVLAQDAYEMREQGRHALPGNFADELACMEEFKMVVPRWDMAGSKFYEFRHDKIQDFFIAHIFAPMSSRECRLATFGDPRFHGVYVLLAMKLPIPELDQLREDILEHGRQQGDYRLFEGFEEVRQRRLNKL